MIEASSGEFPSREGTANFIITGSKISFGELEESKEENLEAKITEFKTFGSFI